MYKHYIFDLYGTLVDIRTNEKKTYLWNKMSELYSSFAILYTPKELKKTFDEIAPKYATRNGGYVRITRIGPRRGDAAEMAIIELI